MQALSIFLFVLSANLDTFTIAVAYGVRKIKIPVKGNVIIAAISTAGTFLSMCAGDGIAKIFSQNLANTLGSISLILLGLSFLAGCIAEIKTRKNKQYSPPVTENRKASPKELIGPGIALTVNNIGMGIGASAAGVDCLTASLLTFAVSLFLITLGQKIGKSCPSEKIGWTAQIASGGLLILLGIIEFFI